MHIFDIPPELLHKILFFATLSCGVTRALRLKLVCRTFYETVPPALFETRLLDDFAEGGRCGRPLWLQDWRVRQLHGAEKTWHPYLAYRVRNENDPTVGRFVEIRRIAEELCIETDSDIDTTVDALCWQALEYESFQPSLRKAEYHGYVPNHKLNLLSAAAYLGHISLAERLLLTEPNLCPDEHNLLFPSPMRLAALAGNLDMCELFREHENSPKAEENGEKMWKTERMWEAVRGYAESGNLNQIRQVIKQPGTTFKPPLNTIYLTRSQQVYQYLVENSEKPVLPPRDLTTHLAQHAEYGNVEMVRYLLDAGADINGLMRSDGYPLVNAAGECHDDVVDLLIERGVDINSGEDHQRGSALCAAAAAGSLIMVRKLLDHGIRVGEGHTWAMRHAVRREHYAMVELLLERDVADRGKRSFLVQHALDEGLQSMAEFLRRLGLTEERNKDWRQQTELAPP
ncbi:ankyrin repeat-containing domain protein [Pseudomassariella vexata]|uniref:Ankyrin repeat-containing domain protein n=1 Tax=Pseudomassariella vexata TaxID=1141098 RepID=A0A1Y2D9H6_9PEZI|nr:ankyrin repeat-containing domain protein [Pseudomassariella vexata]ORY55920.1 ankyrin repeat-containing domain protein [Pseudomassariella vexata]